MDSAPVPPRRIRYRKPIAIVAALFLLYLLLGFFAAPPLAKRAITSFAHDTLQRKAAVGELNVNPLALTLEMKDFALTEADGAPIAAFQRLFVNFQLSSLFRRAWTFSEIALEGFDLRADIAPDGRFNIAALLSSLPKVDAKPDAKLPRVLLQRALVSAGSIGFADRSLATPTSAVASPINLELHDLSTIPDSTGKYRLGLRLPEGGQVDWKGDASLQPLASQGDLTVKGLKPVGPWRFLRGRVDLAEPRGELDVGLRYRFSYGGGSTQLAVEELTLAGRELALATGGEKNIALALSSFAAAGARAEFSAAGGKPWQAKLTAPKLAATGLEYTDRTRITPLSATIKELSIGLTASAEGSADGTRVLVDGIAVNVADFSARAAGAKETLGNLGSIALEGGKLDFAERRISIGKLAVSGGGLSIVRDKDGSLPLLKILAPSDEGALRRGLDEAAKEARAQGKPWNLVLAELQLDGVQVAVADHSFGAPIAYDVRDLKLGVRGYATDGNAPVKIDAALRLEQGGSLTASGEASQSFDRAELRAKVERFNLKPVQPAIATRANVLLASGEASVDVKASYRQASGKHGLKLGGTLRVDNLLVNEKDTGERLLAWKALTATGLSLALGPDQLRIADARLQGLGAKIVVFKDRSTNLTKALIVESTDASGKKVAVAMGDTKALFPVAIERVRFDGGNVDFADLSLVLPFGTKVHQLQGVVEGVSTDRASRATVKLEGSVDEYGLARADGSLAPFHPTSFMDLNVQFRNVDMPPLSPYTVTFAGRRIASGKLSLDLKYKINEGKLAGDNRVVLEKFTLGEKVQSEGALDLPLDLAVAVLTDSDGRIDLAVPVSGDINDPQFDYGAVVWQAVKIVLTKIVTAPFRAIASLFGGGNSENIEAIAFDPGRAALLPPEQEKLKHVAEGLAKRPQLKVIAEGQTGPTDRSALQQQDVALAVAGKLGRTPAAGGVPDSVNLTDAKTQRALEAVFIERSSDEALVKFAADAGKARGKDVDRVNAALALVGRGSEDRAFYEALLKRLNETAKVPDEALAQLADERARVVAGHLTTKLGFPAERTGARAAKSGGAAQVKLELEATPVAAAK
jgi:hypothetical protein